MNKNVALLTLSLVLFGQGCLPSSLSPSATSTGQSSTLGEPSPEGFVAFREGFGKLPGTPPTADQPAGPRPSVVFSTDLPALPADVTILRQHKATPNETLLQNITTAVNIPAGALGRAPKGDALTVSWRDDAGFGWTYDAGTNLVMFRGLTVPAAVTVTKTVSSEQLVSIARNFLEQRGVNAKGWGAPETPFGWDTWWTNTDGENRCMDIAAVTAMRAIVQEHGVDASSAPKLPVRGASTHCAVPEFPTLQPVSYAAARDEQPIIASNGQPIQAARIVVDTQTNQVQEGAYELPQEMDRSNYPVLTSAEVLERLRQGGLNPIVGSSPSVTITITSFTQGLYRHEGVIDGQLRSFFIPALWAHGSARRGDRIEQYDTVVPLIKDSAFAG